MVKISLYIYSSDSFSISILHRFSFLNDKTLFRINISKLNRLFNETFIVGKNRIYFLIISLYKYGESLTVFELFLDIIILANSCNVLLTFRYTY